MFLKNGIDLFAKLDEFITNSHSLYVYSPYIKLETLKVLIDKKINVNAVYVRWEAQDLIFGASDLEIYPYLKSKGIVLYRNTRLHLKAYLDEYKTCFITSANISSRALNIPEFQKYNYELGTIVENLEIEDKLYFNMIDCDSTLITDSIYKQICEQISVKNELPDDNEFKFNFYVPDKHFLVSALPMTHDIDRFFDIYINKKFENDIELNCVLHDLALYKIPFGLDHKDFYYRLTIAFFSHPFIKKFLENLAFTNEIYFGRAKEWIQNNCANVPIPRRWEITENIQILYRWIVELGHGKYKVDRPNHSERLYINKNFIDDN